MKTFKEMAIDKPREIDMTHLVPIHEAENRYVVTVELYMYDKDDKSVIKQAEKLAKDLQKKDDNQASVISIVEQKFGTLGNRKVK